MTTATNIDLIIPGVVAELVVPTDGDHFFRLHLSGWAATIFGCDTVEYTYENTQHFAPAGDEMYALASAAGISHAYAHDMVEIHGALRSLARNARDERVHYAVRVEPAAVCARIARMVVPHLIWIAEIRTAMRHNFIDRDATLSASATRAVMGQM